MKFKKQSYKQNETSKLESKKTNETAFEQDSESLTWNEQFDASASSGLDNDCEVIKFKADKENVVNHGLVSKMRQSWTEKFDAMDAMDDMDDDGVMMRFKADKEKFVPHGLVSKMRQSWNEKFDAMEN